MVSYLTLRRKLQKKLKHKPYRKCPKCGNRMKVSLGEDDYCIDGRPDLGTGWRLFKHCGGRIGFKMGDTKVSHIPDTNGCGHSEELFWSGGGTGRRIPSLGN